jgi:hypothetical protein
MSEELRDDIIPEELSTVQPSVIVQNRFNSIINTAELPEKSRTPGNAKSILEFYTLVQRAIENREAATRKTEDAKVRLCFEKSDVASEFESITIELERREPGRYSEGAPFQGDVKNLRPILREIIADPDNPGYRKAVMGYWHDNLVRFTCWARTNKQADERALEFEGLMEDYTWFFRSSGVSRVLFWGRGPQEVFDTGDNAGSTGGKFYGRSLLYYVKTETIRSTSEKELERIIINLNQ